MADAALHPQLAPDQRPSPELLRAAFRELHGRHLHGFALLLTLGDRSRATHLASDALEHGAAHAGTLRHPERAAAWLRAHVVRHAGGRARRRTTKQEADRSEALAAIGVEPAVLAGLSAVDLRERALIVAEALEELGPLDVATVTGVDGPHLARLRQRARERYATAYAAAWDERGASPAGPIAARIRAALGGAWP